MPTETEVNSILDQAQAAQLKSAQEIVALQAENETLKTSAETAQAQTLAAIAQAQAAQASKTASDQALAAAQTAATMAQAQATAEKNALLAQIAELQSQLEQPSTGEVSDALAAKAQAVLDQAKANDALIADAPVTPPTGDDAAVLAELTDHSLAAMDRKLGPKAPADLVVPEVWQRPQVPTTDTGFGKPSMGYFSQGLSVSTTTVGAKFDYGSTETQILGVPDVSLQFNTNGTIAPGTESGLAVYRLRTEEHAQGQVSEAPTVMWNAVNSAVPDSYATRHVNEGLKSRLGLPVMAARGDVNRYDGGTLLYGEDRGGPGYFGNIGTQTANPPWAGTALPVGKAPLSIAVSDQSEFVFVGVHDRATGKGQLLVYWQWAGQDLQKLEAGKSFPYDFPVAHPGLINSGIVTGTKLFGAFDLPIKFPTSIDVANFSGTGTRISGPDGNASYLNVWKLGTDAERAAFLAKNDTWIPHWGKLAIASKTEKKLVTIDLTALFAGVRDQYFGSQAKYDQTAYTTANGGSGWNAYDYNDPFKFPWGVAAKPEWAPTVKAVVDVPAEPSWILMSESGANLERETAVATADGYVRFYKFDGTQDGEVKVGDNPVHLTHNKGAGRVNGGLVVTNRASRSVQVLSKFGAGSAVTLTIQDKAMVDPVASEVGDVHGLQFPYVTVADFDGKAIHNYRFGTMVLSTQGGATFGMGADGKAQVERGGSFDLPAHVFGLRGTNVN